MLMYLTLWEENLVLGIRRKPSRAEIYLKAQICRKGYDFDILNEGYVLKSGNAELI